MCPAGTPVPRSSSTSHILASRWPHDEREWPKRQCAFYLYKRMDPVLVAFYAPIFAKRTEDPSQCLSVFTHQPAGTAHLAQSGVASQRQALISLNATTHYRLHPKQLTHDPGLHSAFVRCLFRIRAGSLPNPPAFAHRATFHEYTVPRFKRLVRTRKPRSRRAMRCRGGVGSPGAGGSAKVVATGGRGRG
jgi:hypothetical protein